MLSISVLKTPTSLSSMTLGSTSPPQRQQHAVVSTCILEDYPQRHRKKNHKKTKKSKNCRTIRRHQSSLRQRHLMLEESKEIEQEEDEEIHRQISRVASVLAVRDARELPGFYLMDLRRIQAEFEELERNFAQVKVFTVATGSSSSTDISMPTHHDTAPPNTPSILLDTESSKVGGAHSR